MRSLATSMESTCLALSERYKGIPSDFSFLASKEIRDLCRSFDDDPSLRRFFLELSLPEWIKELESGDKKDKKRAIALDFVRKSGVVPRVVGKPRSNFFNYMALDIQEQLNGFFEEKIDRDFDHVLDKCIEKGIFTEDDSFKSSKNTILETFQIHDDLFVLWCKPEDSGMFLETWIYFLLKKILQKIRNIRLHFRTVIYGVRDKNLRNSITEADTLILVKSQPKILIECKRKGQMEDILKFYGVVNLIGVPNGIFINGGAIKQKYQRFENIHLLQNAFTSPDFPERLRQCVEKIIHE